MATGYGGWLATDDWRARVDANITTTNSDSVVVTVQAKIQSALVNTSYAKGRAGKSGSYGGWVSKSISAGSTTTMTTATYTVSRTHKAQSVSFNAQGNVYSSGYGGNGTSTASVSLSIPALPSYSVTFNANGGSGAPSAQTKWYGETLTLTTAKPTRDGYEFLRWNTKADGTGTNYAAGASYTGNAALPLYAIWKQAYAPPTISSLSAYRVNSNDVASDDGEYCHVSCTWAAGALSGSTISGQTLTVRYKLTTASSYTTANVVTLSGASGTTEAMIAAGSAVQFLTEESYSIQITVADDSGQSGNTASRTITLSQAYFTLDLKRGGHGVGIGHSADVDGVLRIGMDVQIDGYQETVGTDTYDHGNFACVDPRLPQNDAANVLANTWGNGLFFYPPTDFNDDSIGNPINKSHGYIRGINLSQGWRGVQVEAQRFVSGSRYTTPLNLTVDDAGNMRATLGGVGIFMTHGLVGQDTTTNANSYRDVTISFGHTYSSAPHVIVGMYSTSTSPTMGSIQVAAYSVSATGATIRIFNNTSSGRSPGFYWLAIGN